MESQKRAGLPANLGLLRLPDAEGTSLFVSRCVCLSLFLWFALSVLFVPFSILLIRIRTVLSSTAILGNAPRPLVFL